MLDATRSMLRRYSALYWRQRYVALDANYTAVVTKLIAADRKRAELQQEVEALREQLAFAEDAARTR